MQHLLRKPGVWNHAGQSVATSMVWLRHRTYCCCRRGELQKRTLRPKGIATGTGLYLHAHKFTRGAGEKAETRPDKMRGGGAEVRPVVRRAGSAARGRGGNGACAERYRCAE